MPLHAQPPVAASSGAGDAGPGRARPRLRGSAVRPTGEAPTWTPAAQARPAATRRAWLVPASAAGRAAARPVAAATASPCPPRRARRCRPVDLGVGPVDPRSPSAEAPGDRRRPTPRASEAPDARRPSPRRPRHPSRPPPTKRRPPPRRPTKSVGRHRDGDPDATGDRDGHRHRDRHPDTRPRPRRRPVRGAGEPVDAEDGGIPGWLWWLLAAVLAGLRGLPHRARPPARRLGRRGGRGRDRGGVVRPRAAAPAAAEPARPTPWPAAGRSAPPGSVPSRTG